MATPEAHGSWSHNSRSIATLGVPTPVTGSQPGSALNPVVSQPGFDPAVISLNAAWKEDV